MSDLYDMDDLEVSPKCSSLLWLAASMDAMGCLDSWSGDYADKIYLMADASVPIPDIYIERLERYLLCGVLSHTLSQLPHRKLERPT